VAVSELFTGAIPPSVYRWRAADTDELIASAPAGWRVVDLETVAGSSHEDVMAAFAAALELPDYFGGNLVALADCLLDVPTPLVVSWTGWAYVALQDPKYLSKLLRLLSRRAAVHDKPFAVLLSGAGPVGVEGIDELVPG
jgi:RNAse (barnase) inhibitor barstar